MVIWMLCIFLPQASLAEIFKDKKRIEEETRRALRSAEFKPAPTAVSASAPASGKISIFEELFAKKYLLRSDIVVPLLILSVGEFPEQDLTGQLAMLKEKKIISVALKQDFRPQEPLHKGEAAQMFHRALGVRGGLMLRIFSRSQRYAFNELVFSGIMPPGSLDDLVSGSDFIFIFTRAADYLAARNQARQARN